MSVVLVDDHLLLRILLGEEPATLRPAGAAIATTGLWYHRLCRALADDSVIGSISRQLGEVENDVASAVLGTVIDLPDTIEMISLRELSWPMAELVHSGARLNLLSLEALAAALRFSAEICLAAVDVNTPLRSAAEEFGITIRTIDS